MSYFHISCTNIGITLALTNDSA